MTSKIAAEINNQYAGKQFFSKGVRGEDYYTKFGKARPAGFPFAIAARIEGWHEESKVADFTYSAPIMVGYNFLSQEIFIKFDGQIKAAYKPISQGFGAILKINDYHISVDFPFSREVISILARKKDLFQLINNIGNITVATGRVEIFDLVTSDKFYDKQYEKMNLSFVPAKKYESLEDFVANIPAEYNINYEVKTNIVKEERRKLPVSLFYGFFMYPSGFVAQGAAKLTTNAKNFDDLKKSMDLKANFSFSTPLFDMPAYNLVYKSGPGSGVNVNLINSAKIRIKDGFFDQLFRYYGEVRPFLLKSSLGEFINSEILYVVNNKDVFKFKELENSDYDLNLDMDYAQNKLKQHINITDFSVLTSKSGIRLKHKSEAKIQKPVSWQTDGVFYINNYQGVVDFVTGYIYRFGKFRAMSEEARGLYIDVDKSFLRRISDYPDSTSDDLSFEYSIGSDNLNAGKIGTVKFSDLFDIYLLELYSKLLDKTGAQEDVAGKMKELIPNLDEDSELLKQILPKGGDVQGADK